MRTQEHCHSDVGLRTSQGPQTPAVGWWLIREVLQSSDPASYSSPHVPTTPATWDYLTCPQIREKLFPRLGFFLQKIGSGHIFAQITPRTLPSLFPLIANDKISTRGCTLATMTSTGPSVGCLQMPPAGIGGNRAAKMCSVDAAVIWGPQTSYPWILL